MKAVLTIAGSDCSGGAGIQADLKTMLCNGVYGMSVITAMTAQNTTGVRSIVNVDPAFLADQIDAVFEDITPDAVKIGMVPSAELIEVIADRLRLYGIKNIVTDPVMVATSGADLSNQKSVSALIRELFPISTLVTPNIPEAEAISGMKIFSRESMAQAARKINADCGCAAQGGYARMLEEFYRVRLELHRGARTGERFAEQKFHALACTKDVCRGLKLAPLYLLEQ